MSPLPPDDGITIPTLAEARAMARATLVRDVNIMLAKDHGSAAEEEFYDAQITRKLVALADLGVDPGKLWSMFEGCSV